MARLLSLIIFLVISCSSPTSDKKPDTGGDVLTTVSIGPSGGVVKAGQITVTIPNGSFALQSTVSISTADSSRFGTSAASASYLLEGIPNGFTVPITVSFECTIALTGDVYIAIGTEIPRLYGDDTYIYDRLSPATVTGSTVSCTISPGFTQAARPAGSSNKDYLAMTATILNDYLNKPATKHFRVVGPKQSESELIALAAYLENIRSHLEGYGFSFELPENDYSLSQVLVRGVWCEEGASTEPYIVGEGEKGLFVDLKGLTFPLSDAMKTKAAIELTSLLLIYYRFEGAYKPYAWFNSGASHWISCVMTSTKQNVDPFLVLKGIPERSYVFRQNIFDYSSYWLLLFEYFNNRYGLLGNNHLLANIYQERHAGKTISESIAASLGEDETTWWPDFVKELISGNVYDIPADTFLNNNAWKGSYRITASDTAKTFSSTFPDLASDIYQINLDPSFASKTEKIIFTIDSPDYRDDYINVLVFGVKGGKPVYIGRGLEFTVTDLMSTTDCSSFLAVAVNSLLDYPYRYENEYSLSVAATREEAGLSALTKCTIAFPYFYHEEKIIYPDGKEQWAGGAGSQPLWRDVPLVRSGNVFTGQKVDNWSGMWGNSKDVSDITITISPDLKTARLDLTKVTEQYDYHQLITQTYGAWDLPVQDPKEYGVAAVWGTPKADWIANKHMENFTHTYRLIYTDGSSANVKVQDNYYCTGVLLQFQ